MYSPGGDWVDQFAHVSLDLPSSSGVLLRHLNARLVHSTRELVPHPALPVCRMVWWVFQVWVLYNNFLRRIGLQKQAVGELLCATLYNENGCFKTKFNCSLLEFTLYTFSYCLIFSLLCTCTCTCRCETLYPVPCRIRQA